MSSEENNTVARRVLEDLVTQARLDLVDEIYAPNFQLSDPTSGLVDLTVTIE